MHFYQKPLIFLYKYRKITVKTRIFDADMKGVSILKIISLTALTDAEVRFGEIEVFPESWAKRRAFTLYKESPRPTSALFLLASPVTASFTETSGGTVTARRGDVVYIPEGAEYHVRVGGAPSGAVDTYTVNFRLSDVSGEPLSLGTSITVLSHTEDDVPALRAAALDRAVRQTDALGRQNRIRVSAAFYSLLDAILSTAAEEAGSYYPIRVGVEALRSEWNRNEHIGKYAALSGVSSAYFYRAFREWSGKSPVEYRNLLRLSNAETMLRYTDMRVSEISEYVGFDDPFYFCRVFAKHYGSSPQKYRKAFRTSG